MPIANYCFIAGIPYLQNHVKGPKWVPFVVGVHLNCFSFSFLIVLICIANNITCNVKRWVG